MTEQVPPHSHEFNRVHEQHLIPDPTVYSDLPESAEEGRFAVKLSGSDYSLHRFLDGSWREMSAPPAWDLVAHATASSAGSITVSGLDLDADGTYHVIVKNTGSAEASTSATNQQLRFNGDSGSKYSWVNHGYQYLASGSEVAASGQDMTGMILTSGNTGNGFRWFSADILISRLGDYPRAQWQYNGHNADGSTRKQMSMENGAGHADITDNVTSLTVSDRSGGTANYEIWVFRPRTN